METTMTVTENRLKFETFKKKRNKSFAVLPKWFDEKVYNNVLQFINKQAKLNACKYLLDISREKKTNTLYDLRWTKVEIADEIERIGGSVQSKSSHPSTSVNITQLVTSLEKKTEPSGFINKQEVLRVLEPFAKLANHIERHAGKLPPTTVLYAYNGVSMKVEDLVNIQNLVKRLSK